MASKAEAVPRDAATLVIVDNGASPPRVLLGKRRSSQAFAPNKYVFPGGSLDAADIAYDNGERLAEHNRAALLAQFDRGSRPIPPEAFARAALRETYEETGLVIGKPGSSDLVGAPPAWHPFLQHGVLPNLSALTFIARAITPPGRPRRFDARFFLADAAAITHRAGTNDGEFEALVWVDFAATRELDLHGMTREIVAETERFLAIPTRQRILAPVPFYFQAASGWQRSHISRSQSIPAP